MADIVKIATREAYGNALCEFANDYDFVVLDADLAAATKTSVFKKQYPDRFFNTGIAEGNMMSVAAGIASCGKTVFASSFAMFAAGRAFEQVRNSICYPNLNVKIGATHAGISVGEDGATHQCIEDIALMRAVPNMVVISPCDAIETREAVKAVLLHNGPVYLRLCRLAKENIFENSSKCNFQIGKSTTLREGNDLTIVATGIMVHEALSAYEKLKAEGINARVIDMHTIKPIDKDALIKAANETGAIVTAEEHNVIGGLGSAVCEVISEASPVPVLRIGVKDKFGTSGSPAELFKLYNLTADDIYKKSKEILKIKR